MSCRKQIVGRWETHKGSPADWKSKVRLRWLIAFACAGLGAPLAPGATVWTGPLITYNQPSPDPTQAANQDRITANVWLTRFSSQGLFNAVTETNAGPDSPADTEWAFGRLTNYAALSYSNWLDWLNGNSPTTLVGKPAVLHLISDDIYLSIEFTLWGSHGSGGFAYQRSTAQAASAPTLAVGSAAVANGQFSFSCTATSGLSYVVKSSSDLVTWEPIQTNVAPASVVVFSNAFSPGGSRFYRVVQLSP
ncbi:MAG: hypothetical protein ABSG59_08885 [Verrucomicrobiota bacterium]